MKTDLCRRDGSQGALGIVLKSAVQRYWFKSTMYVRTRHSTLDTQHVVPWL
jgi:hypothetical protein